MTTRVAIMQPYFMPYAGYFRLMEATDVFVVYDCVQFPRRGWVHRNKLTHINGNAEWLTLPLAKADRNSTRIMDLAFAQDAQAEWEERLKLFPALKSDTPLMQQVRALGASPTDYLEAGLKAACQALGIQTEFMRSSQMGIDPELRGQDRILAIAEKAGATDYINASGGTELYEKDVFAARGMQLHFLKEYDGGYTSMLERLQTQDHTEVFKEIQANCQFQ